MPSPVTWYAGGSTMLLASFPNTVCTLYGRSPYGRSVLSVTDRRYVVWHEIPSTAYCVTDGVTNSPWQL